ncbi:biliverdin-producing heme oxygenase [Actimicrobium sp. CCC2.4]|uniref:biliverdin-producing heme oxygenase n=1 Tax=Actimicrobium sp. CCC2.4 TaxID=3048606 RepID=UPI002AC90B8E|nr:biliverdin-producing heme oxygenase [Actimicrobium sp. CCC2.4]MEB0135389.1 biliverdin-producing heme oxygenase [Actimicrobium sp. CCC2.4]WPX32436.1 biliverdin-producing heme oxygenase [Actimicrobium sp. CCC2.4]
MLYDAVKHLPDQITMPAPTPSALHQQLRLATKEPHHALDHHPLMARLLAPHVSRDDYGDALAAMHGIYANAETALLTYLAHHPDLFDYAPRRKLPALEADLAALGRQPFAATVQLPAIDRAGALFGMLYTLEGATLGGQFIATRLRQQGAGDLPMQFYTVYGEHARSHWLAFLESAEQRCPQTEYPSAVATAVALFEDIRSHLDTCRQP